MFQRMRMNNNKYNIKPLELEDAYKFRGWERGNYYLLNDYDFIYEEDWEIKEWLKTKKGIFKRYFAIYYDDKAIAYIGLKEINILTKSAELFIVMDVRYQNQGHGYKILVEFLNFVFTELKFKRIWLDVNAFNERAIHLYKKLGFTKKAYYLDAFNIQDIDKTREEYIENEEEFIQNGRELLSYVYTYEIKRGEFFELHAREN